jgi:histidinol-phosphate aminotransferase
VRALAGCALVEVALREGSAMDFASATSMRACRRAGTRVKLVYLCSPNNPTGNSRSDRGDLALAERLRDRALLVVDEAYVEFSARESLSTTWRESPTIWRCCAPCRRRMRLAGARIGCLIAAPELIALLRN